jgi:uncharacterized protein
MPKVESENLSHVSYDPSSQVLTVEFHRGGAYQYHGVPIATYETLLRSASVGDYFANHIKGRYRTHKLRR